MPKSIRKNNPPFDRATSKRDDDVSILIAGDLYPGGKPEKLLIDCKTEKLWPGVAREASDHDLCIVNLECPLTNSNTPMPKSGPHLRADPRCAEGIKGGGFHLVTLANNHILDMGEQGLTDTLSACHTAGIETVGAGRTLTEATAIKYLKIKELNIAIINVAENEFSIATNTSAGAWPLDLIENYRQIQEAKAKADFILVILHGGNEYYPLPSPQMQNTCRFFAEVGADSVVCHHSHVPSGIECYNGVPIFYSTGNFLFDWPTRRPPGWYSGYMVSLIVCKHEAVRTKLLPYWQCKDDTGVHRMNEIEEAAFLDDIKRLSRIIAEESALTQAWEKFCEERRLYYLSSALSLTRIERKLLKMGLWPFWRLRRQGLRILLNLVRCESHNDVLIKVLNEKNIESVKK